MVVLSDTKTDYGSFAEPSQILVVSGGGGGSTTSMVVTNRHPSSLLSSSSTSSSSASSSSSSSAGCQPQRGGSAQSSSQSLNINSNYSGVDDGESHFASLHHHLQRSNHLGERECNNNHYQSRNDSLSVPSSRDLIRHNNHGRSSPALSLGLALGLVSAANNNNNNSGSGILTASSPDSNRGRLLEGSNIKNNNHHHHSNNKKCGGGLSSYNNSNHSSPMSSTNSGDLLFQRQPLLQHECNNGWGHRGDELIESASDEKRHASAVRIDIPPMSRRDEEDFESSSKRFPKERRKTIVAFLFLACNFILSTISLALTHERLPDRNTSKPLPDIVLDNVNAQDWALDVSEILIVVLIVLTSAIMMAHRHRWIVFRRAFMILGILYFFRSMTMYVTVLPVASNTYYCSPKANSTSFLVIAKRVIQLVSGFGLSINGQQTYCGDYIFSGHTVMLVMGYLIIQEYTPKKLYLVHWGVWLASLTGIVMVLVARGHYTIDVLLAYYVTTRIFWIYHTMAHTPQLKNASSSNYVARVWWYPLFRYLEGGVGGALPKMYSWPWTKVHRTRRFD